jgi:hypothetical protein
VLFDTLGWNLSASNIVEVKASKALNKLRRK